MCCKYPVFNLFNSSVREIKLMENGIGDTELPWYRQRNTMWNIVFLCLHFYSLLFWILSHICFPVTQVFLSEYIFSLLIPVNSYEITVQLQSTLSKAFWCSVDALHKFFFSRLHFSDIAFYIFVDPCILLILCSTLYVLKAPCSFLQYTFAFFCLF